MAESADATPETNEGARSRGRRRSTRKTTEKTSPAATTGETATTTPTAEATAQSAPEGGKSDAGQQAGKKTTPRKTTRKTTRKSPQKATTKPIAEATAQSAPEGGKDDAGQQAGKKTTPRKTTRKTTRKSPQKTTTTTTDASTTTKQPEESTVPASAVLAADFDRAQLTPKMRVHALAKLLGMTSKDVIAALNTIGLTKVAQSTLSLAESGALLDALGKPAAEAPGNPDAEPVEKIRQRVEKNVANEIHQIEEKVERELADHSTEQADTGSADAAPGAEEPDEVTEAPTRDSFVDSAEEGRNAELLEDVVSEVTPAPADEPAFQPPIFRAPMVSESPQDTRSVDAAADVDDAADDADGHPGTETATAASRRRRRGRRGGSRGRGGEEQSISEDVSRGDTEAVEVSEEPAAAEQEEPAVPEPVSDEPVALKGSTRLEAQRRRRTEMREEGKKKRHIVSQAEFLARRESVERTMVVRERERHDHDGLVTQVGVLEDDLLVEHFVTSEEQSSLIGNIYLGRVQNVLPSMEAAFIDIGKGRNGVLYAGEVDWKAAGLGGRGRRIEQALRSGDQVLVQVTKDPVGHKGARLTTQISLAGRFLVYVPGGRSAGISRKLPAPERKRLKDILKKVVPAEGGTIIRTAAENVPEDAIGADVARLHRLWEDIQERSEKEKNSKGSKPLAMYEEPNMLIKVIRDMFNEDFQRLVVDGPKAWNMVHAYVQSVAPDLLDRVQKFDRTNQAGPDAFEHYRVDEQLQKALSRKVWLPSGGSLVIDRTEAMTVVDVNTGKFTGSGGNLEETVTRNNLEAAEEIVRQLRLRDIGGMIVIDFIDMVLPENRDLVLRRLTESLGRDRTRHQVSEVTSLGLVQLTRKRLGTGLLETFSTECEHCAGRGLILHDDPVEHDDAPVYSKHAKPRQERRSAAQREQKPAPDKHPVAAAARRDEPTEQEKSIEELAAAVIVTGDSGAETPDRDAPKSQGRSRGRGRRRAGAQPQVATERRVPVEPQREDATAPSDLENIVAAAVDRADQEDPEEPSGADYTTEQAPAATGDVDTAVAEFEASPRRKRRTRGNSRSDHRPGPANVQDAAPQPVAEAEAVPAEPAAPEQKPTRPRREQVETVAVQGRRNRRRVVRRNTVAQPETAAPAPERPADTAPRADAPVVKQGGRGRRRVVRKAPQVTASPATQPAESTAEQVPTASPAKSGERRRSGRRSARRSNR